MENSSFGFIDDLTAREKEYTTGSIIIREYSKGSIINRNEDGCVGLPQPRLQLHPGRPGLSPGRGPQTAGRSPVAPSAQVPAQNWQ